MSDKEYTMAVSTSQPLPVLPRPDWLRVRFPTGSNYLELKDIIRSRTLHTVCEEAHCPNIGECWENRTATFIILGRVCTPACPFCAITTGVPGGFNHDDPAPAALTAHHMPLPPHSSTPCSP